MGRLRTIGAALAGVALVGCGKDFDALFADGPDAAADGGSDGAGPSSDAGVDASCAPSECKPKSGTDDGVTTYSCSGCQCACPAYACPTGARCSATCNTGTSCSVACDAEVKACDLACEAGTRCESKCGADESCTMKCKGSAACLLTCSSQPGTCSLECESGAKRECGDRVFACNRECP